MRDQDKAATPAGAPGSDSEESVQAALERCAKVVDTAMKGVQGLPTGPARTAMELKDAVEAFHKEGLVRLIRSLRDQPGGLEALQAASTDPFVHTLLSMHGILRQGIDARIKKAIDSVRPLLHQHGGDVEFVRREDDTVFVKLFGSCTECTLAPLTLDNAVRDAVTKAVPEIRTIELERFEGEETRGESGKVVIEHPGEGWHLGPMVDEVPDDRMIRVDVERTSVIFTRAGGALRAWLNQCPHQRLPLDGGEVRQDGDGNCTLVCPWHGWEFDAKSGACSAVDKHLIPLPLIERGGACWVRLQ